MNQRPLNAAILGTGFMGGVHGRSLMSLPDVRLTAICGRTEENATRLRNSLGASDAGVYSDFDQMLEEAPPDVLVVCLPPHVHCGQVESAAQRGVNLFLEKPLALTVARSEAIAGAVERAGVISQVGYHYRFKKSVRRFMEIASGDPTLFQGRYWCRMDGSKWWRSAEGSGGQIYEQAVHMYDLALAFCGRPAVAWGQTANLCHRDQPDYTIEDTSAGMVRFQNGALASITASNCAVPDRFVGDFRVVCRNAMLDYRSTGDWRIQDEATIFLDGAEEKIVEDGNAYLDEVSHFLNCVRTRQPTGIDACAGLESVRLVSAVLRSAEDGAQVSLVASI